MKNKRSLPYPLIAFVLGLITWVAFLGAYGTLGYGNYTLIRGDLYAQYIDFISMFLRVLKGEDSFWYSFSIYLGSGTVLTHAYYCFTPFSLLYLLDFISIPAMTAVIIGLKFALASACFTFFAGRVLKQRSPLVLLFALGYAFNSFSVSFYFNMIWLDALYMLPILVWLLFELVERKRFLGLTLCWFYLFMTNFYMAYTLGIFAVLAFAAIVILRTSAWNKKTLKNILGLGVRFGLAVILAAGMAAAFLMPAAIFILSHLAGDNFEFKTLKASVLDVLNGMFAGVMPHQDNDTPLLYCGLPTLLLLPFYFACKRFSAKERILSGIVYLFFVIGIIFLPLFVALHAFDYPNWYGFRFTYIMSFIACALACRVSVHFDTFGRKPLLYLTAGLVLFFSFMMHFWPLNAAGLDVTSGPMEFAVNLIFLVLWCILLPLCTVQKEPLSKKYLRYGISVILIIAELVISGAICMQHTRLNPIAEGEFNQWYYPEKEAIDTIRSSDPGFYRISAVNERSSNAASMFGYAGFNTFSTSDVYDLRTAMHNLGIGTFNRAIEEYGYTPITYMLFGRKYTITLPEYDPVKHANITAKNYEPATIEENEYALPLGYMVRPEINAYTPELNPFKNQEALLTAMTGNKYSLFQPLSLDDVTVTPLNMRLDRMGEKYTFARQTRLLAGAYTVFSTPVREDQTFYACFARILPEARSNSANIIAKTRGFADTPTLSFGCVHEGKELPELFPKDHSTVSVYFPESNQISEHCDDMFFALYDNTIISDVYADLSSNVWDITDHNGDTIIGTVTSTPEKNVLFTTIPWEKGWVATVDGIPADITPALNDAFISLPLTPGTHEVCLHYIAPGSKAGFIISLGSLLFFAVLCFYLRFHKKPSPADEATPS